MSPVLGDAELRGLGISWSSLRELLLGHEMISPIYMVKRREERFPKESRMAKVKFYTMCQWWTPVVLLELLMYSEEGVVRVHSRPVKV